MKYCIWCGEKLVEGNRYCTGCGKPIENGEPEATEFLGIETATEKPVVEGPVEPEPALKAATTTEPLAGEPSEPVINQETTVMPLREVSVHREPTDVQSNMPVVIAAIVLCLALGATMAYAAISAGCTGLMGSEGSLAYTDTPGSSVEPQPLEQEEEAGQVSHVVPQDSISDYSWEDLSLISQEMSEAGGRNEAMAIAEKYGLVSSDGTFPDNTKIIALRDGTKLRMRLVDIMHDNRADGRGKASMTFLAANTSHHGKMADKTTTDGGWASSSLRTWMQVDLPKNLPSEVYDIIVPVEKYSNNVGKSMSINCVSPTKETVWAPSIVELTGPVDWEFHTDPGNSSFYSAVFNAEGEQYAYYAQHHVGSFNSNTCLSYGEEWWMRSTAASTGRGRFVTSGGDPSAFGDSYDTHGIVIGFCI